MTGLPCVTCVSMVEWHMSRTSQAGTTPDFLQAAAEYRDRLRAELARVDEFLRSDGERAEADRRRLPDFLLLGDDEVLEELCAHGERSGMVH